VDEVYDFQAADASNLSADPWRKERRREMVGRSGDALARDPRWLGTGPPFGSVFRYTGTEGRYAVARARKRDEKQMSKRLVFCWPLLVLLIFMSSLRKAKVEPGTVAGRIGDLPGAVFPAGNVAIKSAATALKVRVQSKESGRSNSPPLKPGEYEISVGVAGF